MKGCSWLDLAPRQLEGAAARWCGPERSVCVTVIYAKVALGTAGGSAVPGTVHTENRKEPVPWGAYNLPG